MSFLARRMAASEGAYFSETSKQAIARLREKAAARSSSPSTTEAATHFVGGDHETINADVLPEILQHSLPRCHGAGAHHHHQEYLRYYSLPSSFSPPPSSLASSLPSSLAAPRSLPPHAERLGSTGLYAFLPDLPQASLGPRRWTPELDEVKMLVSTANEARMEGMPTIDDAKAKALMEGYATVMKAFLIGTALVVGGAIVAGGVVSSKLEIHSIDDMRVKGHEHMQPRAEAIRQSMEPWKQWLQQRSGEWNIGDSSQHKTVCADFSKVLGLRQQPKEDVKPLEVKTD